MIKLKYSVAGILMAICLLLPFTASAYPNEKNGFRDLQWGTTIEAVRNQMVYDKQMSGVEDYEKKYIRKTDDLILGRATLWRINYTFRYNQLTGIDINARASQRATVRAALEANFGVGEDYKRFPEDQDKKFRWVGDVTTIVFEPGIADDLVNISITSTKLHESYGDIRRKELVDQKKTLDDQKKALDASAKF